jgi:hypothetical protein
MSNSSLWLQEYINYCQQHQRITLAILNSLVEQDRRLHSLVSRQTRHSSQRVHPESSRTPIISSSIQTTLDPFLRSTRTAPRPLNATNLFEPQWTSPPFPADFFRPVPIRPTQQQISRAIVRRTFSQISEPLNATCPITQNEFSPNDEVYQISHCRHLFTPSALQTWFENNTHCPLCRFDIRTNNNAPTNTPNETNDTNANRPVSLHTLLNSAQPSLDLFSNLTQVFNIPLDAINFDISGGVLDLSNGIFSSYSMEAPFPDVD